MANNTAGIVQDNQKKGMALAIHIRGEKGKYGKSMETSKPDSMGMALSYDA